MPPATTVSSSLDQASWTKRGIWPLSTGATLLVFAAFVEVDVYLGDEPGVEDFGLALVQMI